MSVTFEEVFTDFTVVAIPTRTNFRGVNLREAALFRGPEGWSEFSPFLEYDAIESSTWLKAAIEAAYQPWPVPHRSKVKVNATMPRVSHDRVPEILDRFPGCDTVKIKVDDFEGDSDLVEAVLDYWPDAKIRLDVNGGWSLQEALLYLHDYNIRFGKVFEYIEQPCNSIDDLQILKQEIPMKIAVDESVRKSLHSDFSELKSCADIAIIKWAPCGGFEAAHRLIEEIGLPVVVSSALDTGVGIAHGVALAASIPSLDYACGLGTVSLLTDDVCEPSLVPIDGGIEVRRPEISSNKLAEYQAPQERQIWWRQRVMEIWNGGLEQEIATLGWLR